MAGAGHHERHETVQEGAWFLARPVRPSQWEICEFPGSPDAISPDAGQRPAAHQRRAFSHRRLT